ncbi:nucleotidyltransferase family protein, partial [Klebsiella pneumoniae]|nr:nucleotidyltransferase family protein [Klebsiella pneumoniae]
TAYPSPALRSYGDIDLLVRAGQLAAAVDALAGAGAHRHHAEAHAGFDRRFAKAVGLTGPHGVAIDLHRTLVVGPAGFLIDLDDLFAD